MILPPDHFTMFNSEVKRLMTEREANFRPFIQKQLDEAIQDLLDSPLQLSQIILPE